MVRFVQHIRDMKAVLGLILLLGIGGLAFSGYLTYREMFAGGGASCSPVGEVGSALGAPPCVYGFFMYLAITLFAVIALVMARKRA